VEERERRVAGAREQAEALLATAAAEADEARARLRACELREAESAQRELAVQREEERLNSEELALQVRDGQTTTRGQMTGRRT
jgi:hypothetical protein